jgi:2-methylisocitrate lyase-like PEP mutase family enzyme
MSIIPRTSTEDRVKDLRAMLSSSTITLMPCCYDGLTARLVEQAGFDLTFMTGFGVAASYGLPDTGLLTASEMWERGSVINNVLERIPCIGDGDTGYGNPMNIKRTVKKYSEMGFAGIMIEDQVSPKRCGHTKGKDIVSRDEAYNRIRAAVEAREELKRIGKDIVILARTDARALKGLDEAIERCQMFRKLGADWTFLEAPQSIDEMKRYCKEVDGPKLANMLEFGKTPILPPSQLQEMGYTVAAYPLTLLSAATKAMEQVLVNIKEGKSTEDLILPFDKFLNKIGFDEYNRQLDTYPDIKT